MKKAFLVFVFIGVLATGTAFADHPGGWGLGIMGRYAFGYYNEGSAVFSLKAPMLPVYWGVGLIITPNSFSVGISGDYYFIDKKLVPAANLHWYLGGGVYGSFYGYSYRLTNDDYSAYGFGLGGRIPIGLSWQPLSILEVFVNLVPSIGLHINTEGKTGNYVYQKGGLYFPTWGCPLELGVRFWIK